MPHAPSFLRQILGPVLGLVLGGCAGSATAVDTHLIDHRWRPGHQAILTLQVEVPPSPTPTPPLTADCLRVDHVDHDGTAQPMDLLDVSTPRGSRWTRITAQTHTRRTEPVHRLRLTATCSVHTFSQDFGPPSPLAVGAQSSPSPANSPPDEPTPHKLHRWLQPWLQELQQLRERSRQERAEIALLRHRMIHRDGQATIYGLFGLLATVTALLGGLTVGLRVTGRRMWSPTLIPSALAARPRPESVENPRSDNPHPPPSKATPPAHIDREPVPRLPAPAQDFALLERQRPMRTLERVQHLRREDHLGEAVLLLENELQAAPGKSGWLLLELLDLYETLGMQHPRDLVKSQIGALFAVDTAHETPSTPNPSDPSWLRQSKPSRLLLAGHPDGRRLSLSQFRLTLKAYADADPPRLSDAHGPQNLGELHQRGDATGFSALAPALQIGHELLG